MTLEPPSSPGNVTGSCSKVESKLQVGGDQGATRAAAGPPGRGGARDSDDRRHSSPHARGSRTRGSSAGGAAGAAAGRIADRGARSLRVGRSPPGSVAACGGDGADGSPTLRVGQSSSVTPSESVCDDSDMDVTSEAAAAVVVVAAAERILCTRRKLQRKKRAITICSR
jgi:hypothetical protein